MINSKMLNLRFGKPVYQCKYTNQPYINSFFFSSILTYFFTFYFRQYLKNTASQHENDWKDKYNKAEEYVRSQLGGDDNLELLVKQICY